MTSRIVFVVLLCALISNSGYASGISRKTITTRIALSNDETIFETLKTKGISLDENSTIFVHEEKNAINLTCFDCVIHHVDSQFEMFQSKNEWVQY